MKKFLALTLSLLMVLSCMTCLFTVSASATADDTVTWQTPTSWASVKEVDGTPAVEGPLLKVSAQYQAVYTRVNLAPNADYELTMYVKGIDLSGYPQFSIVSSLGSDALDFAKLSGEWTEYKPASHLADGATQIFNSYYKDLGATNFVGADGETWNKINVTFTTANATEYVVVMNCLPPTNASSPAIYFSDVVFKKKILGEWKSGRAPVVTTTESDGTTVVPYQNGPAYRVHTWPCNQSLYTTANLEANTTYNFTAYFKGNYIPPVVYGGGGTATDGKGETWVVSANASFDDCRAADGSVSTDGTWLAFDDNDGYENLYKQDAYRDEYTNNDTWRKYSFNFTTGTDTKYYIILGLEAAYSGGDTDPRTMYMSDVSVKKFMGMSAVADGNGSATVSNENPDAGEEVVFTAKPYAGVAFSGWYNGDVKVSSDSVYTVTAEKPLTLTAKFEGDVISFTSPASWAKFVSLDGTPAVNGALGKMQTIASQAFYTRVTLNPNTKYTYQMYIKNAQIDGKYNQFTIVSSLGSDELDFAKATASKGANDSCWRDYKVPACVEDGAEVVYNSYFKDLGATDFVGADGETWKKINVTFTTTSATEYVLIMNSVELVNSSDNNVYLSDYAFIEDISMTATAEGNGTATVSNSAPQKGQEVTFTAKPYAGVKFLGWYNGSTKVSAEPIYSVVVASSLNLTAKFEGDVISFTSPASWVKFVSLDGTPAVNGALGKMQTIASQAFYTRVTLNPNTKYTYQMYIKNAQIDGKYNQFTIVSSLGSDELDFAKATASKGANDSCWRDYKVPACVEDGAEVVYNSYFKDLGATDFVGADGETWKKINVTFTTTSATEYVLIMNSVELVNSSDNNVYLSDYAFIEHELPVPDLASVTEYKGSSLRKESESAYGQAIRHKFTLDKAVFTTTYEGYKLVEFGFVTAVTADLGANAYPVLGATDYKTVSGVAYKASYDGTVSKNIVFAEDDNTITYTAALYNISDYAKSYTVVPYVIYENSEGNQVTRYGKAQTASIFDVAKAILSGNNADDIAYVNNTLLAGDYKTQYDAWVK